MILKITTLPSKRWVDKDEIILHVCFKLLHDFVVHEKPLEVCADKEFVKELKELFDWWQTRKDLPTHDWFEEKDQEMLFRLIKIRPMLWT